ncbi:MAG: hypothetical protein ABI740_03035 [Alphaproteobacteria bacterium]
MLRASLVCALAMMAASCQSPAKTVSAEPLDPFVVGIDAQRWGVIIDKAQEGVIEAPYANVALEESDALRADTALKSGAAKLIVLRNDVCRRGLLSVKECALSSWPAWTMEPPTSATPLEVLDKRSAWLGETMDRFTAIGCAAGKKASGDEQFCSVE